MKRAYIFLTLVAATIGILLCFAGPLAFIQEQKLLIPRIYSVGLEEAEIGTVQDAVLTEMALNSQYSLVTPEQFDDFVATRGIQVEQSFGSSVAIREYARVANIFGVGKVLSVLVSKDSRGRISATYTIRETSQNLRTVSISAGAESLDDFLAGNLTAISGSDSNGRSLSSLRTDLSVPVQIPQPSLGMSLFSWLVLAFYLAHILAALLFLRANLFSTSPLDSIRESLTRPSLGWRARLRKTTSPPSHPGLGEAARWSSDQGLRFHPEKSARKRPNPSWQRSLLATRFRNPGALVEALLALGVVLFLFSWMYAENANLDYVKRFIALDGGIRLAENVSAAKWEAVVRFAPLMLINILAYVFIRCLPRLMPRVWDNRHLAEGPNDSHRSGLRAVWERWIGPGFKVFLRMFRIPRPDHTQLEAWLVRVSRSYTKDVAGIRPLWVWVCSYRLPLSLLSAALFALSLPSQASLQGIPLLGWIALVPLFLVIKTSSFSQTIFYLTVFGALQSLLVNFWHSTYGLIALPFVTVISAAQFFLFGLVMGTIRNLIYTPRVLGRHDWILWPLSWVIFDYLRSMGYAGYPWGFLGASQYSVLPVIQISELFGVWGVTFLLVLVNSVISHVALPYPTVKTPWNSSMVIPITARRRFPAILTTIMLVSALIYGSIRIQEVESAIVPGPLTTLVQPNTDPRKADPYDTMDVLLSQTESAPAENPEVSLVFWPEGALPYDISRSSPNSYPSSVRDMLRTVVDHEITLITGTNSRLPVSELPPAQADRFHAETPILESLGYESAASRLPNFNSVLMVPPTGTTNEYYEKIRLVPFTEYFPYKEQLPWLYKLLDQFNSSDWAQGWRYHLFSTPAGLVVTPICFEDVFPDHIRKFVQGGASVLAVVSNDYWSLTPVEAQQHAAHALFRAVENRRPMIRSTASGLTSFITPTGAFLGETLPYYEEGFLTNRIPLLGTDEPPTLYTLWGDWFPLACCGIFVLICLWVLAFRTNEFLFRNRSG